MIQQNIHRSSPDSRQHMTMNPKRNIPANIQTKTNFYIHMALSKKSSAIKIRFKEEGFSISSDQCIDLTLRGFHICANNHSLVNNERLQLVDRCVKGEDLKLFLKVINPQMTY